MLYDTRDGTTNMLQSIRWNLVTSYNIMKLMNEEKIKRILEGCG